MKYSVDEVKADLDRYFKGMMTMNGHATCYAIERKYQLHGYSPEIVSVGLNAGANGDDIHGAIDAYLEGDDAEEVPA